MRLLDLTIGTRHFYLPDDTDLEAFEREIENAARTGGSMIGIPGAHHDRISALITPSTTVFVERIDLPDDTEEDQNDLTSSLDFDLTDTFSEWNA